MPNGRILVCCPTRGKPELLMKFADSIRNTSTLADLVWYVADDDPRRVDYKSLPIPGGHFGPPLGYVKGTDALAANYPGYSGYFTGEDDYECVLNGWDRDYLSVLPEDGVAMVWDCFKDYESSNGQPHTAMLGWGWLEALGKICPVDLQHGCVAFVWRDLADAIGRNIQVPQTCFHHNQQSAAGISWSYAADEFAYRAWQSSEEKIHQIAKLKDRIACHTAS